MSGKSKVCANPECEMYKVPQPLANFYLGGNDSYCVECRKVKSAQWRLNNPGYQRPQSEKRPEWDVAASRAPTCPDHRVPSTECGCALGARFHKTPQHRAKIAAAHRGKKLSDAHRAAIAAAQKVAWALRKSSGQDAA